MPPAKCEFGLYFPRVVGGFTSTKSDNPLQHANQIVAQWQLLQREHNCSHMLCVNTLLMWISLAIRVTRAYSLLGG